MGLIELAGWRSGEDIAFHSRGLGFNSRAGHIELSVTNGSPPLRRFFGAVLPRRCAAEMDPATRYMLRYNTASIMRIFLHVIELLCYLNLGYLTLQPLEETAQRLLGKSVFVNWPHMEEAKVVAVSNGTSKVSLELLIFV